MLNAWGHNGSHWDETLPCKATLHSRTKTKPCIMSCKFASIIARISIDFPLKKSTQPVFEGEKAAKTQQFPPWSPTRPSRRSMANLIRGGLVIDGKGLCRKQRSGLQTFAIRCSKGLAWLTQPSAAWSPRTLTDDWLCQWFAGGCLFSEYCWCHFEFYISHTATNHNQRTTGSSHTL